MPSETYTKYTSICPSFGWPPGVICISAKSCPAKTRTDAVRKVKNAPQKRYMATLMPTCTGWVGLKSENVKVSLALVRPKWACKQQTHVSAAYFACPKKALVRREREPKRQRSDRSEKRSSKEGLSDPFRRRKSDFFASKCFVSILRIMLPAAAGSTFL